MEPLGSDTGVHKGSFRRKIAGGGRKRLRPGNRAFPWRLTFHHYPELGPKAGKKCLRISRSRPSPPRAVPLNDGVVSKECDEEVRSYALGATVSLTHASRRVVVSVGKRSLAGCLHAPRVQPSGRAEAGSASATRDARGLWSDSSDLPGCGGQAGMAVFVPRAGQKLLEESPNLYT
ncbi:hypothetical protein SKAU_G00380990 [Synaphobranchus kaupii]|uniref:Uncharacterized protein n=1 Tax=Synaphobranchus kaupii TaxID=118154 RepID=A0A9Q1EDN3_SYNKA|nr:hypothetical protein SKAU_G00380990 [Synaphobranchus kaupii]